MKKIEINQVLIEYVVKNFTNKFTEKEKHLYNLFVLNNKLQNIDDDFQRKQLLKNLKVDESDFDIIKFINLDDFLRKTILRLIEEENIYINRCPFCGEIAKTPLVKRGRCGHQW